MHLISPFINEYIEYTLLTPETTHAKFEKFLNEAIEYNFTSVCVSPSLAEGAKTALLSSNSKIKVCTVVDFPHGNKPLFLKIKEVDYFINKNINEIDFVLNIANIKNNDWKIVIEELHTLGNICKQANVVSKCIVQEPLLTDSEALIILHYVKDFSPIDYIKTSTGFGYNASLSRVIQWNSLRKDDDKLKIKAAGGIRTLHQAFSFIQHGADRLGISEAVKIMEEYKKCTEIP